MDLSVLIVTYNSARDIERCLKSVQDHLDRDKIGYELCVVDNASADNTVEIIRRQFPTVKLICESRNLGFAGGIQSGLAATAAPFVLWLNPDAVIERGSIRTVLDRLRTEPRTGIAGLKILNPDGSLQLSCRSFPTYATAVFSRYSLLTRIWPGNPFSRAYLLTNFNHEERREVDWVSGACLLHRRELAQQIGPPDDQFFMYCEDVDFCYRAKQAGWKVIYDPAFVVTHRIGGSSRPQAAAMILEHHRSMWRYYRKHYRKGLLMDLIVYTAIKLRAAAKISHTFIKGVQK